MASYLLPPGSIQLELPEEVDLQIEIANVGSRLLATLVDLLICGTVLVSTYLLVSMATGASHHSGLESLGASTLLIFLYLIFFGFHWGYFNLFEWLWNGQTPGKRALGLRVIKWDGSPVSAADVFMRNLARPIDTFGPLMVVGLAMIFFSRKGQRLGDLMAQTLVVREAKIDWNIFQDLSGHEVHSLAPAEETLDIRLNPGEWELLRSFLQRRETLDRPDRLRLATQLSLQLKGSARGTNLENSPLEAEAWLVELGKRI